METTVSHDKQLDKVKDLIEGIRIGMLTTLDDAGHLVSRPMACMQVEDDGSLWFFTKKHSGKVGQIENTQQQQVNVAFADTSDSSYVSISGHADELDDKAKISELWSPMAKPWFPDGQNDPELTLLHVHTEMAEYWDSNTNRMVRLLEMARAIVTGGTYQEGEHGKVMA
jgi:general stress protein 26